MGGVLSVYGRTALCLREDCSLFTGGLLSVYRRAALFMGGLLSVYGRTALCLWEDCFLFRGGEPPTISAPLCKIRET